MQKTKIILATLIAFSFINCFAGIEEEIAKTIVRVRSGNKYSTGFFWKNGNTIITTFHSLESVNNVQIYVPQISDWRRASVERIYKRGDIILIKIQDYSSPNFISKTSIPAIGTETFTIGYYKADSKYKDRKFKVGLFEGNTLEDFLPKDIIREVKSLGFPDVKTEIVYLDGHLLHGFSGSPIVDFQGKLIGIADGGLENGVASISWCIKSAYLTTLENSTETISIVSQVRTNSLFAQEDNSNSNDNNSETEVKLGNFKFKKIKTRTFSQLDLTGKFSSSDALGLNQLLNNFNNININCQDFVYDIYLEENSGATIAIPSGETLGIRNGMIMFGSNNIKYYLSLINTNNMQQDSQNFENIVMPNYNTNWMADLAWTYPTPYYGLNNSIIRRRAYFGNYNMQYQKYQDYLFETLTGKGKYFLGVAAKRNDYPFTAYPDIQEWAKFVIGIQLTNFSN
jgi:hypothetical protein